MENKNHIFEVIIVKKRRSFKDKCFRDKSKFFFFNLVLLKTKKRNIFVVNSESFFKSKN